jgi:hypothetical protein
MGDATRANMAFAESLIQGVFMMIHCRGYGLFYRDEYSLLAVMSGIVVIVELIVVFQEPFVGY